MNNSSRSRRSVIAATMMVLLGSTYATQAVETEPAIAPIRQLVDGLLQVMKAGAGTPFSKRFDMLAPVIDASFDLNAILRVSVGAPWASLPPDQQALLTEAFRRYTVATYVNSFDGFDGQHFVVSPTTRSAGGEQVVVQTQIVPKSGESHELDYVMRDEGSSWRAVDVLAEGSISRVAVQRSDFRRLLARGGAQALVDSLRSKSADLSDGSS